MRTKRKFLVKVLGGLAVLATAFAFVCAPKADKEVVSAATSTDWVEARRTAGNVQTFAASKGLGYDEETNTAYQLPYENTDPNCAQTKDQNPWTNIVQMKLNIVELNASGLFIDGYKGSLASQWQVPLFAIKATSVQVAHKWGCDYDNPNAENPIYDTVESNGGLISIAEGKTLEMNKTYDVEFAFDNVFDETDATKVIAYKYYFKMWSGEDVLYNFTFTTKTYANKNFAADANATAYTTVGRMFDCKFYLVEDVSPITLTSEKDISYYWAADSWFAAAYNPDNTPVRYTDTTQWLSLGGDSATFQQYYPIAKVNAAMTFRFKADKIPTTGKFAFIKQNTSNYDQYTSAVELDYTNDKVNTYFGGWGKATEVAFTLDAEKEYDIYYAIYYAPTVGTTHGSALVRTVVTDVATGTSVSTYQAQTAFAQSAANCNQMHVAYGRSSNKWVKTDENVDFTISAANPCWNATVTDGSATTKTNRVTEIALPEPAGVAGKTFIGWATENTFYKAGETVDLTANTTFTATYAQFGTVEAAAVRVEAGENGNETGIRFKGYVNAEDWAALTAIDADIEVCMIIERDDGKQVKITITADDLYDVEGEDYKEFAVVISITADDNAYYSTVYAAKTFVAVTYAGDESATYVTTDEMSRNSVQNIATVILANGDGEYTAFLASLTTEQRALLEAFAAGTDQE